jgi:hypothetical protein
MAPIIEASDENYEAGNRFGISPKLVEAPEVISVSDNSYIEIPELNLAVAKERTHQNKNWYESHEALQEEDSRMLTLPEFVGFLNHLRSHEDNPEYKEILKDIVEARRPWRSEGIDSFFEKRNGELYVLTQNRTNAKRLNGGLMQDTPGISLEAWLQNPTQQGLPRANVAEGDLYYFRPLEGAVVKFDVDWSGIVLTADNYAEHGYPELGVRAAKQLN